MVAFNSSFSSEISQIEQVFIEHSLLDPSTEAVISSIRSIQLPFTSTDCITIVQNLKSLKDVVKQCPKSLESLTTVINKLINFHKLHLFIIGFEFDSRDLIGFIEKKPSILLEIAQEEPRWFTILKGFIRDKRSIYTHEDNIPLSILIKTMKKLLPAVDMQEKINEKTLVDHALENEDYSFLILLVENGFEFNDLTPNIVDIFKINLKRLDRFFLYSNDKLENTLLKMLIESKSLPFLCLHILGKDVLRYLQAKFSTGVETEKHIIFYLDSFQESRQVIKILRNGPEDLRELLINKWCLNDEIIKLLFEIDGFIESLINPEIHNKMGGLSLYELFEIFEELDQTVNELITLGFSESDRLIDELTHLKNIFMPYLEAKKERSETHLERFGANDDNPMFLYLHDKSIEFVPEGTNLLNPSGNLLYFLVDAVKKAHQQSLSEKGSHDPMPQFLQELFSILEISTRFTDDFKRVQEKTLEIIKLATNAPVGFPVFAPTLTRDHYMSFCLQKNENGTYKITIFNTGFGVDNYHYSLPGGFHVQTFLSIDQVNPDDALNPIHINKMLNNEDPFRNIHYIYGAFKNWGKSGIMLNASPEIQDYEQTQLQGTCSAQSYMAFLRYFSMSWIAKSGPEKLGFYKEVKARVFTQLTEARITRLQPILRRSTERKMIKYNHELELLQMLGDPLKYTSACEYLQRLLETSHLNEKKYVLLGTPRESLHERFDQIRTVIREIGYHSTEEQIFLYGNVDRNIVTDPLLKMIQYRYQHKVDSQKIALEKIQQHCENKNYKAVLSLLEKFIGLSKLVSPVIRKWAKEKLESDLEFVNEINMLKNGEKIIQSLLGETILDVQKP